MSMQRKEDGGKTIVNNEEKYIEIWRDLKQILLIDNNKSRAQTNDDYDELY